MSGAGKYPETPVLPRLSRTCEFKNLETPAATHVGRSSSPPRRAGHSHRPPVGTKAIDLASRDKKPRRYPIDLETTSSSRDEFTIELPVGWSAESLPKPVALDPGFASYASRTEAVGPTLVYRREYRLIEPLLPASRHDEALKFFLAVGAEEQQSLLLKTGEIRSPDVRGSFADLGSLVVCLVRASRHAPGGCPDDLTPIGQTMRPQWALCAWRAGSSFLSRDYGRESRTTSVPRG
jgi:hypothetical protein